MPHHTSTPTAAIAALLAAPLAHAAPGDGIVPIPTYTAERFELRPYLTGDWGGARAELAAAGVTLDLALTQLVQGVASGGLDETTRYGGRLEALVNLDLDRMGALHGGLVSMRVESRYGNSVNRASGAVLPVADLLYFPLTSGYDEDIAATVTELLYTQFLSKELALFAGKFTILGADSNEFAGGDGTTQFLGHPFTSASVTSLFNPYSTLGGGVSLMPTPELAISTSVYASTDSSTTSGFDTLDAGLVWSTALAWQYRLGDLPGGVRATYQYAFDREFVNFAGSLVTPVGVSIPVTGDSWCAFANAWQYLVAEEAPTGPIKVADGRMDLKGVGLFLRAGFADPDTNPIRWIVSGGIAAKGLLPGRDRDTIGIGYAHSRTSELPIVTSRVLSQSTARLEAYYDLSLTPAANLTFDLQVADPLFAGVDDAVLLGMRLRLEF